MRNCLKSKTKKTMWVFFFYKYGIFLGIFISNKLSFSELWLICNSPNILAKLEAWRLNFAIKSCFCKGSLLNQKYLLFLIPILQWGTHCNLIMFQDLKYRSYCIWLHLFFKKHIYSEVHIYEVTLRLFLRSWENYDLPFGHPSGLKEKHIFEDDMLIFYLFLIKISINVASGTGESSSSGLYLARSPPYG